MPGPIFISDDQERADAYFGFLLLVDALNAFMFNHGPMTPTLMDVLMLTGLNIHATDRPFHLLEKASFKIETKSIGG